MKKTKLEIKVNENLKGWPKTFPHLTAVNFRHEYDSENCGEDLPKNDRGCLLQWVAQALGKKSWRHLPNSPIGRECMRVMATVIHQKYPQLLRLPERNAGCNDSLVDYGHALQEYVYEHNDSTTPAVRSKGYRGFLKATGYTEDA